jgi:hypothetical protein
MNEGYPWYGAVQGEDLEQGDLLHGCPYYQVNAAGVVAREAFDVIVLSHSCDLAHGKLNAIQICPY